MERRKFIQRTGLVAGGAIVAPYILPSGRLFAASGNQLAQHVVFVMFGGGIRQQESVLQQYLLQAQPQADGTNAGNIMYNMFEGAAPTQKVVYGNDGALAGDTPIPKLLSTTLQKQGTLFREARTVSAGHFKAYTGMVQGRTEETIGLRQKPIFPTVFEYVRRHMGAPASKVWFVGETISNSIPLLNYSTHQNYGIKYGANFFAPPITFGQKGFNAFAGGNIYHPEEEMKYIYKMKYFLDNYYRNIGGILDTLGNTEMEKYDIKKFMERLLMPGSSAADPIDCAIEIMKEFKPTLTVVNFDAGVDSCHGSFTTYLRSIHRNDHNLARIWQAIGNIPGMAGNTAIIICPDMGRNLEGSATLDENNFRGFDHSDANTRRIFIQMAGPGIEADRQIGDVNDPVGNSGDCVMTISELLGIKSEVQSAGFLNHTTSLLEYI